MGNPLLEAYRRSAPPRHDLTGGRKRIFPTRHPDVAHPDGSHSNVVMMGMGTATGREYVIPTMVGGKQLSVREAEDTARAQGLHKYPSFKTPQEGEAWAAENHGNIGEDGFLKQKTPSAADFVKAFRHQRRNLVSK
jgi:hypothetical protein